MKNWQSPSLDPWSNCLINSREDDKGQSYYYSGRQKDNSKTICGHLGYEVKSTTLEKIKHSNLYQTWQNSLRSKFRVGQTRIWNYSQMSGVRGQILKYDGIANEIQSLLLRRNNYFVSPVQVTGRLGARTAICAASRIEETAWENLCSNFWFSWWCGHLSSQHDQGVMAAPSPHRFFAAWRVEAPSASVSLSDAFYTFLSLTRSITVHVA